MRIAVGKANLADHKASVGKVEVKFTLPEVIKKASVDES